MPDSFQQNHPNEMKQLRLNSRKLTTPFDIHATLKHILNFAEPSRPLKLPRGLSLFSHIPVNRSCHDADIEAHWCSCLDWINININENGLFKIVPQNDSVENTLNASNMTGLNTYFDEYIEVKKNLKSYSRLSIKLANKAIKFINSLIGEEYRQYCELIRLKSIERLSRLNLNQQLLAFKKSKDIHGREALFEKDKHANASLIQSINADELMLTLTKNLSGSVSVNETRGSQNNPLDIYINSEIIFQIVLTTWPGNASYELSFKYNIHDGLFKFNKNEISRINNYNGNANCMLNKRPDLRQFCYCK